MSGWVGVVDRWPVGKVIVHKVAVRQGPVFWKPASEMKTHWIFSLPLVGVLHAHKNIQAS